MDIALPDLAFSHPTHTGLEQRVLARLKKCRVSLGARLVVGFSGGADSLALVSVLQRVAPRARIDVLLVHVDHGLRPESATDAEQCARLSAALGLPFETRRLELGLVNRHPRTGVEEAARRERYVALADVARGVGATALATAHHLDDQAETVLLHLLRGAGLTGSSAMSELSTLSIPWWNTDQPPPIDMVVWRPFLAEAKVVVRAYAAATGLPVVEDGSNLSRAFKRNAIRLDVLPLLEAINPGAIAALGRFARISSEEDRFLAALSARAAETIVGTDGAIDITRLTREPLPIQRRVLSTWLGRWLPDRPSLERVEAILAAITYPGRARTIEVVADWIVVVDRDNRLYVSRRSDIDRAITSGTESNEDRGEKGINAN